MPPVPLSVGMVSVGQNSKTTAGIDREPGTYNLPSSEVEANATVYLWCGKPYYKNECKEKKRKEKKRIG
ncbi:hypothetical protein I7I50_05098 [Histoplasma capsulatum G186AR]|uniref:Uncharacterized protein n=1 Tax=Ajellomyces capsulatus TaxID=5037 RepID=A0A8H7Z9W5_AJECA|nr:hypothetical protein I7I52_03356 [Histoplasma capsulatum]QSS75827.1 hypothetical protein I7I50_05098 [Histoplasma capsulatum G186AR]